MGASDSWYGDCMDSGDGMVVAWRSYGRVYGEFGTPGGMGAKSLGRENGIL